MPNIEIHGYGKAGDCNIRQHVSAIISKSNLPQQIYREIVVTYIPSSCYSIFGETQPFLRVCSDNEEEIKWIAGLLNKGGYEIEALLIHKFYPKP